MRGEVQPYRKTDYKPIIYIINYYFNTVLDMLGKRKRLSLITHTQGQIKVAWGPWLKLSLMKKRVENIYILGF